ncbi:hypothetical protein CRG98_037743 [Punica granatum]|uniref:Uncharacterized protein n=1 Tax=Punica granatum TaxID=22663 RepID=A0A2I0IDK0_PUNGR|nr:hypothetical protein CRG98_037743 [Punica granatum]
MPPPLSIGTEHRGSGGADEGSVRSMAALRSCYVLRKGPAGPPEMLSSGKEEERSCCCSCSSEGAKVVVETADKLVEPLVLSSSSGKKEPRRGCEIDLLVRDDKPKEEGGSTAWLEVEEEATESSSAEDGASLEEHGGEEAPLACALLVGRSKTQKPVILPRAKGKLESTEGRKENPKGTVLPDTLSGGSIVGENSPRSGTYRRRRREMPWKNGIACDDRPRQL